MMSYLNKNVRQKLHSYNFCFFDKNAGDFTNIGVVTTTSLHIHSDVPMTIFVFILESY